jgi:pimeloyl-ACP methyl ester carboxylesterase
MRHSFQLDGRLVSYLDVANPADAAASAPRGADRGRAGAVLLLHAFPLAAEMWHAQLSQVPSGWRFVAPDLRGFGASAPDGGEADAFSIDDYALDALALLDHLDIREAVVCGLSMGGYVAFAICRLAPGRIRGLVLADTRPDADSPAARAGRQGMLDELERDGAARIADSMVSRLLGPTTVAQKPEVVRSVRRLAAAQSAQAVRPAVLRLMTRPDSTPWLASIACPVLVVAGEDDAIAGPDVARQMHDQIPGAELALVGKAGHLSNLERPEAFNAALDRFLATRFTRP